MLNGNIPFITNYLDSKEHTMANTEIENGRLTRKVALVTGAGSGIGKACSAKFINEGAKVVGVDLKKPDFNFGPSYIPISGDVTNSNNCEYMVEAAMEHFGRVDILVNSAGVSARNALPENSTPEDIWDKVVAVNLKGTYLPSWHVVPEMKKAGGGSIVNLASIMGIVGYPVGLGGGFNAYPPSKGGVVQFTKTLATDLARENIRVNCLCPGFVETNLTENLTSDADTNEMLKRLHPMGRLGQAEEIAAAALFLASDDASFITGSSLVVDGGYTAQ